MRIFSKLTGGIAAAALVAAAASPASARGWHGDRYRHHDRGPSAGEVIGAIAAVGLFAAIASAASKKKTEVIYEDAPPPYYPDEDLDRAGDDPRYDSRSAAPRFDDGRAYASPQDAAVDACVVAARDEASRNGDFAEIRSVTSVSSLARGWNVTGQVEQRANYRAADGWSRSFSCAYYDGRVSGVTLD